ncbi:CpaF family protein [Thalassospiraceae bacterium LMO-JJ14]|nr:CpaF family protein [Thalassospiraceae bacterium LMO-JJ14]
MFGKRQGTDIISINAHRKRPSVRPLGELAADENSAALMHAAMLGADEQYRPEIIAEVARETLERADEILGDDDPAAIPRAELAKAMEIAISGDLVPGGLSARERRDVVTEVVNTLLDKRVAEKKEAPENLIERTKALVQPILMDRIDVTEAGDMPRQQLAQEVGDVVAEILTDHKIQLNLMEQREIVTMLLNDMLGFGPLEVLLADEAVTDIMVNGPEQVFVEKNGKLTLSGVTFRDNRHVMQIASRIVSGVGRRVDESSPLCDARLPDGSRVNIIIPPLAIDGPSISIRKFSKKKITLDVMQRQENVSPEMATVLKIASRSRLNILVSGGTGSGKTTLLNALSRMIDAGERIVTIEDAAELQLQQPHVVRLETRPPNLEGDGEITQRELVKNALRMRPDRIILGEIRAGEALDMLQAMNTGHDGSLGTIHANRPREALTRLENMVAMAGVKLPNEAVRAQIAGAVDLIVQISRMRDGKRRITHVTEVVGMEGEVVTTQDLFTFEFEGEDKDGNLFGSFKSTGLRPAFMDRAKYFGLDKALMEAMG